MRRLDFAMIQNERQQERIDQEQRNVRLQQQVNTSTAVRWYKNLHEEQLLKRCTESSEVSVESRKRHESKHDSPKRGPNLADSVR